MFVYLFDVSIQNGDYVAIIIFIKGE